MLPDINEILKLPDNWDNDGARQVSENIGIRANRLAVDLYQMGYCLPREILPTSEGTITLSWWAEGGMCDVEMGEAEYSVLVELYGPTPENHIPFFGFKSSGSPHLGYIQAMLHLLGFKRGVNNS